MALGHRGQLGRCEAAPLGLSDERARGRGVALAGSGGHRQAQPLACRGDRRGFALARLVASTGGVPGRGWDAVVGVALGAGSGRGR